MYILPLLLDRLHLCSDIHKGRSMVPVHPEPSYPSVIHSWVRPVALPFQGVSRCWKVLVRWFSPCLARNIDFSYLWLHCTILHYTIVFLSMSSILLYQKLLPCPFAKCSATFIIFSTYTHHTCWLWLLKCCSSASRTIFRNLSAQASATHQLLL